MVREQPGSFIETHDQERMYSPDINAMMREVLHLLGDIDFKHEVELDALERSAVDAELKNHIKRRISTAYRERREPYVELLTTLRQRQHRLSFPPLRAAS